MREILGLITLLLLFSCGEKDSEYKKINHSIAYQYVQVGEEQNLRQNGMMHLKLMVTTEEMDTLHFVPNYNYFIEEKKHPIDSAFRAFNRGDSLIFKTNRELFNTYLKLYGVMNAKDSNVLVHVRLIGAYADEEALVIKQSEISRREIEEQAELKKYLNTVEGKLDTLNGIYCQFTHQNDTGQVIQFGSQVSIHYKGYFLDGYVFDNTYEKSITPSFTFGQEYQMIDGLQTALNGRKEGESVKIILPSRHAFGEEGSLAGIVPPYTAVIYDVNIIKVIN